MPAYTTISIALSQLATARGETIKEHGRDPHKAGFIQLDNVQNYLRVRDQRIGSANVMNIGLAATFRELRNLDPRALDLEDMQRRVVKNERADLTVMQLLSFIDTPHLNTDIDISLHWLRVLVDYVPELAYICFFQCLHPATGDIK
jgi:hypothetical protein